MHRWPTLLAGLAIGAGGLAACGSGGRAAGGSDRAPTRIVAGESVVGGRSHLTFRPVLDELPITGSPPTTPPGQVTSTGTVVLATKDATGHVTARYELGPVILNGRILGGATAVQDQVGQWQVDFVTTKEGSRAFDAMAMAEYQHRVAVVLGDLVLSAPQVNATSFNGRGQITGNFTAQDAKALAAILNTPG